MNLHLLPWKSSKANIYIYHTWIMNPMGSFILIHFEKFTNSEFPLFSTIRSGFPCPLSSRWVWRIIPTMVSVKPSSPGVVNPFQMAVSLLIHRLGGGFKWLSIFTSIWGNGSILTSIFRMGWNHQLVRVANYLLTHPATVTSIIAAWCASEKATLFFDPQNIPSPLIKWLFFRGEGCVLLHLIELIVIRDLCMLHPLAKWKTFTFFWPKVYLAAIFAGLISGTGCRNGIRMIRCFWGTRASGTISLWGLDPWKINMVHLQITHEKRKMIWTKPPWGHGPC